jgi:hypothetical protein
MAQLNSMLKMYRMGQWKVHQNTTFRNGQEEKESTPVMQKCWGCRKEPEPGQGKLKACAKCNVAVYCSPVWYFVSAYPRPIVLDIIVIIIIIIIIIMIIFTFVIHLD